jgi:hypothetical protein
MTDFKPKVPSKPEAYNLIIPGANPREATKLSEELLGKNNQKFHIFFNDRKFHK